MSAGETPPSESGLDPGTQARPFGWRLLWVVIGGVITYALVMVLALNKPSSLRGERVGETYADVRKNDRDLDLAIVAIVAVVVGLVMVIRGRLRLAPDFIIGQWLALLAALIVILVR